RITRRRNLLDPLTGRLAGGLFSGLVGFMACAFFLTRTYNPVLYFLIGLGIGMIRHVQRQGKLPAELLAIGRKDLIRAGTAAFLSIPAIWLMIKVYWAMGGGGS